MNEILINAIKEVLISTYLMIGLFYALITSRSCLFNPFLFIMAIFKIVLWLPLCIKDLIKEYKNNEDTHHD